ncbi:uncharacterized protein HMPREF1541_05636 [Cyphellophora europaea CBS 101466]|uniref:Zn(2)-C6 fungal-type domain-containing protein n=1 Tax=Cyphellophora europaea (strain CBS 101466) TaxID=1220924 RepID=W2RUI2_CYPE1|nr:uncharacterized protein HMPREF1541_05636 [Cyphellophora europaea CBS 101466]ETN39413.1 hypothetical protein HMPREF1541_05636 [Cyphellophora europaea CBS 101466]
MPGVPTSKGCEACRRRKKGCDLVQPTCGRCTKLGLKCINNGTGRLKFVDESKTWAHRKSSSGSNTTGRSSKASTPSPESTTTVTTNSSSRESSLDLQVAQLCRSALLSQAVGAFWEAYTPRASGLPTFSSRGIQSSKWLQAALREAHSDPGLNDAVMALAMSRASRISGNKDARKDALMFYGSCVRNVRRAIVAGDRLYDDHLLATVMLLATFEVHEGTAQRDKAWGAHINGASRLINARGAWSFQTEFGRILYLGHLRDELIYGIGTRGKSRHGVDQTSYKPTPEDMTDLDVQLVSILSSMPSIMESADHIRTIDDVAQVREATLDLRTRCHEIMDVLEKFDETLQWSQADLLYWEEPSQLALSLAPDSDERVFTTFITFCDFPIACLQFTTWTSLLLMHSTLWLTYQWLRCYRPEAMIDQAIPMMVPPDKLDLCNDLAINIVKSMEYFVQPEMGLVGAQQIAYPMSIVMGYLTYWNRQERMWFPVIFRRLKELNIGIEGFLVDTFKGNELRMIRPLAEKEPRFVDQKQSGNVFAQVLAENPTPET